MSKGYRKMKINLTVKTGKGKKSKEKEVDGTVDKIMEIIGDLENGGYKVKSGKCFCDGESVVLEK